MNHARIERCLEAIEREVSQAKRSYELAKSSPRYAPQIENLISSLYTIGSCQRTILRDLGIDPSK